MSHVSSLVCRRAGHLAPADTSASVPGTTIVAPCARCGQVAEFPIPEAAPRWDCDRNGHLLTPQSYTCIECGTLVEADELVTMRIPEPA